LQAALSAAQPGDTINLAAGATYTGNFRLAPNSGPAWITIQSSALGSLPGAGTRVSPDQAAAMPKIVTPNSASALQLTTGTNYYRFIGIEFFAAPGIYIQDVIQVGIGAEPSTDQLPHDVDFDRVYVHADASAGGKRGTLAGLPPTLPPLLMAYRLQERAAGIGFDWPDAMGPMEKVKEEIGEVERETGSGTRETLEAEIGDLLFAVVNLSRKLAVDPRAALERANLKFMDRFEKVEKLAEERGLEMGRASLEELDKLWDEVKKKR